MNVVVQNILQIAGGFAVFFLGAMVIGEIIGWLRGSTEWSRSVDRKLDEHSYQIQRIKDSLK